MRKQLKEASGLIVRAKDILVKISEDRKIPDKVRDKSRKIVESIQIDIEELERMREY